MSSRYNEVSRYPRPRQARKSTLSPERPRASRDAARSSTAAVADPQGKQDEQLLRMVVATDEPPPRAVRHERVLRAAGHGHARVDAYAWLRTVGPAARRLAAEENAYVDLVSATWRTQADPAGSGKPEEVDETRMTMLTSALEREFGAIRAKVDGKDIGLPLTGDGRVQLLRRGVPGADYPCYVEQELAEDGGVVAERLVADMNEYRPVVIGDVTMSPSRTTAAFSVDDVGDEEFAVHFRDMARGVTLPDELNGAFYTCAWADDEHFLYVEINDAHRPWRVICHRIGTAPVDDVIVFEETDELFEVTLSRSKSNGYIYIESNSAEVSEVQCVAVDAPTGPLMTLWSRERGALASLTDNGTHWFACHNADGAVQFCIDSRPMADGGDGDWQLLVAHDPGWYRYFAVASLHGLLVLERSTETTAKRILVVPGVVPGSLDTADRCTFDPEGMPIFSLDLARNLPLDYPSLRCTFSSPALPTTTLEINIRNGTRVVLDREVVRDHEPNVFTEGLTWATSDDGTRVPVSYIYRSRADDAPPATRPMVLRAYGAYGVSTNAAFETRRLALLSRGFVLAFAHVRGGAELGREWYLQGRRRDKVNSFRDFVAAARHMVASRLCDAERIVAWGRSAGGLLVTAAANMTGRSLFRAIIARVAFTDVVTSMLDRRIPLIAQERLEWGEPEDEADYAAMLAYSPYDQLATTSCTPLFYYLSAGLADTRVLPHEPLKFAARLRHEQARMAAASGRPPSLVLLRVRDTGHFISEGLSALDEDVAEVYAFIIQTCQIPK